MNKHGDKQEIIETEKCKKEKQLIHPRKAVG